MCRDRVSWPRTAAVFSRMNVRASLNYVMQTPVFVGLVCCGISEQFYLFFGGNIIRRLLDVSLRDVPRHACMRAHTRDLCLCLVDTPTRPPPYTHASHACPHTDAHRIGRRTASDRT